MRRRAALVVSLLLFSCSPAQTPIIQPFAMPDVVMQADGETVYAFAGTDVLPFDVDLQTFVMPYWRCFSSRDLVHWYFESMLDPAETYMGKSNDCWASHGIKRHDQWYWYFSQRSISTGVATARTPGGPWKDALGKPLLPADISPTAEYDNCAFIDDDGLAYLVFGAGTYHIVELNEDMISLKTKPQPLEITGIPDGPQYQRVDAPFLHKYNGAYYLSWRRPYAVSKFILGPYAFVGRHDAQGHGGFFKFKNQWFVNYTTLKTEENYRLRYRFCSLAYVHYKDDGSIAPMEGIIRQHGVGQYDAGWGDIQAEWHMGTTGAALKKEISSGFEMRNLRAGDYLRFPNVHNVPRDAVIELKYSCGNPAGGRVSIRAYEPTGPEIGGADFRPTGSWDDYQSVSVPLDQNPPGTISLALVFLGQPDGELLRLDSFRVRP